MTHGIRTLPVPAFALCALVAACSQAPDPAQLTAVDQLISATDAALLTLNELDRERYLRTDSLLSEQQSGFAARFDDTLDRTAALALGSQYVVLRAAEQMGADHERVLAEIGSASERLRSLRNDLAAGAIEPKSAIALIATEQQQHAALIGAVHRVIDNYKLVQQAWDRRDSVAVLLAGMYAPGTP